jgi:hypothetical protein
MITNIALLTMVFSISASCDAVEVLWLLLLTKTLGKEALREHYAGVTPGLYTG